VACVAMYHLSSRHPISKDLVESLLGEAGGSAKFSEFSRASLSVRPTSPTRDSVRLLRGEDEKSGKDKKSAGKSRAGRRRRRGAYAPPGRRPRDPRECQRHPTPHETHTARRLSTQKTSHVTPKFPI